MATTANSPPGAVGAVASADLFTSSPSHVHPAPLRYAAFDNENFSLYTTNSPSTARRALDAHLKDTDRRIQDASRLGSTLVQQRKTLAARLREVEQMQQETEMPADLRHKLAELEQEYNEVGRESARAFLPKSRVAGETGEEASGIISGSGRESPTKVSAPSRRQRNQPSNRVHDIEFATEISTSLLAQVRQLQAALADKDAEAKDATVARAQLEAEAASLVQRIRHMDENEQRYKDENWNLETRLQEVEANLKGSMDVETRLTQTLKATQMEKAAKERELDDLKVTHEKLNEDHAMAKKVQEADLHGLRRDINTHETEKYRLHKKIEDLTAQNTELARAVSYRFSQAAQPSDTDFVSAEEGAQSDDQSPLHSEPASPIKGTPARHGVLETETLKSSLNHAHRMIQNLKNAIHREKTERIETKRMLQDARDELEARREHTAVTANSAKKRRTEPEGVKFKRPSNLGRLGAARSSTTEVFDGPDWEDQDSEQTPSKPRYFGATTVAASVGAAGGAVAGAASGRFEEEDSTDAFETANEREITESEAFATGNEGFDDDTEGDATETESGVNRTTRPINSLSSNPKDRRSFMSTASTSADEDEDIVKTPIHNAQPKYKLRLNRSTRRSGRVSDLISDSPSIASNQSPASSTGTPQPPQMQSLGDELDALDDDSLEGTPASSRFLDDDLGQSTPAMQRQTSAEPQTSSMVGAERDLAGSISPSLTEGAMTPAVSENEIRRSKPAMVDAGIMTEPWEPEHIIEERIVERVVEVEPSQKSVSSMASAVAGGALAGLGFNKITENSKDASRSHTNEEQALPDGMTTIAGSDSTIQVAATTEAVAPKPVNVSVGTDAYPDPESIAAELEPVHLRTSPILSQETEPILPPIRTFVDEGHEAWALDPTGEVQPSREAASRQLLPTTVSPVPASVPLSLSFSSIVTQEIEPIVPRPQTPVVAERDSKDLNLAYAHGKSSQARIGMDHVPGTNGAAVGAGFFAAATVPTLLGERWHSQPSSTHDTVLNVSSTNSASKNTTAMLHNDALHPSPIETPTLIRTPLNEVQTNIQRGVPTTEKGSQTLVSGEDIEDMLKNKTATPTANFPLKDTGSSPVKYAAVSGVATAAAIGNLAESDSGKDDNASRENQPSVYGSPTPKGSKRPATASSVRSKGIEGAPPLPPDHTEKIAAAQQAPGVTIGQAANGVMGPPLMAASSYKARPRTPSERPTFERRASRESTTSRTTRAKDGHAHAQPGRVSRRTSVSSFASELDERFNITRGHIIYPTDVEPATDPRMIQAITQTMIGEYLWKYTRRAGRSETSSSRHRRFFWVHPYTRTLYWSEQDPSTAGKNMLKAKSVAIEAVRVISDDNAYPPGLHRKSVVVVTPGREVVFTAPTGQRHETWFNALSYLLLRTEREKSEAEDTFDQSDIDEFNPVLQRNAQKSVNKTTGRSRSRQSRASLSSYNSRTTRTSSPPRLDPDRTPTQRHGTGTVTQRTVRPPPANGAQNSTVSSNFRQSSGSVAGRFSSLASRFRPVSSQRTRSRVSLRQPDDPAQIYDASLVADSAEDLRAVIEQQERDADRLENVRACCDGKHDVGSLSRNQRHTSFGNRLSSHALHSHSHPHRS